MTLLELFVKVMFWILVGVLGVFSLSMVYVLLGFGKSKILGFFATLFYALLMSSLFVVALDAFNKLLKQIS